MSIIRGNRYPVGTWRVCQQCREFYTEAQPCPCRRSINEEYFPRVRRRGNLFPTFKAALAALKRWWRGDV